MLHRPHRLHWPHAPAPRLALIGCGGTGSALAEILCRLLTGTRASILLADPDTVEPHNLLRQNFRPEELGRNKAQVLAERLADQFGRPLAHYPGDCRDLIGEGPDTHWPWDLTICCVDNALARAALHQLTDTGNWILDTGNGKESGQVFLGNISREAHMQMYHSDYEPYFQSGSCYFLPAPALQEPALLTPAGDDSHADRDCAQAVLLSEQSPLINQAMALAAAQFVYKLLTNRCHEMAAYLDLRHGNLRPIPATPANAARALQHRQPLDLIL